MAIRTDGRLVAQVVPTKEGWTNRYGIEELPAWTRPEWKEPRGEEGSQLVHEPQKGGPAFWSGKDEPPQIGAILRTNFASPVRVVAFYVEYGWLGIECELLSRRSAPAWWKQQHKPGQEPTVCLYGIDIQPARTRKRKEALASTT